MTLTEFLLNLPGSYCLVVDGEDVKFNRIQFSESSMSVFIPMVNGDEIHNHMLVVEEDGMLKSTDITIKDLTSGEEKNVVLTFNDDGEMVRSETAERLDAMKDKLDLYRSLKVVRQLLFPPSKKLVWSGGSQSYGGERKVVVRTDEKPLTKKSAAIMLTNLMAGKFEGMSIVEQRVVMFLQKHPDVLRQEYEVDEATNLAENIYWNAARLYLYRVSCMYGNVEFPVIVNENFRFVEENGASRSDIF